MVGPLLELGQDLQVRLHENSSNRDSVDFSEFRTAYHRFVIYHTQWQPSSAQHIILMNIRTSLSDSDDIVGFRRKSDDIIGFRLIYYDEGVGDNGGWGGDEDEDG
ncbi:hypothetical protein AKJ16_DCAP13638 [Drosera capensis]